MYENHQEQEQIAVLAGIDTGEFDAEYSMRELEGLAEASGARVAAVMIKKRRELEAATLLGSGAMEELREVCRANEADLLIFDCELTPSQQRNIADLTDTAVLDRTMLILDIFAQRARSSEGRIQVELAQLKYMLPRLSGKGMSMSRLGGGIGTRGPGETKWRQTAATSAAGLNPWRENCAPLKSSASASVTAAGMTASRLWRLSATRMRANPP